MRVAVLASGSSGNALFLSSDATRVLVDAGLSARRTLLCLEAMDVDPGSLDAILITHEHRDHVCGLGPLSKRLGLPVFATAGTLEAIGDSLRACPDCTAIAPGASFTIGDLSVSPFSMSHDSADPVCFSVSDGERRVAVATDLGTVDRATRYHLSRADCVVLEFNHDEELLLEGSYPWPLKQRVMSNIGHLSNDVAANEVERMGGGPLSLLILAHLSQENNTPRLAEAAATRALSQAGREDVDVKVASQDVPIGPFDIPSAACVAGGERHAERTDC